MRCPKCQSDTLVIDSRERGSGIMRRRKCVVCQFKFTTREVEHVFEKTPRRKKRKKKVKSKVRLRKQKIVTKLIIPVANEYTKRILQKLDSR